MATPCAFEGCRGIARGEMHLVTHNLVRHSWPICDAHAACLAIEEVRLRLRCMDTAWECRAGPLRAEPLG